jgi:hypothetical protein
MVTFPSSVKLLTNVSEVLQSFDAHILEVSSPLVGSKGKVIMDG